ncbi:mechanosensitive ion channel family protein [Glaciecola sp. 33A]|jgi:miniconductance mechanosensitive channel|uniref:mechanosensitive ion channel family protein n=1 Tax=Glaciecola sp. 33A TaxID=2057807 RepID=UPI000C31BC68|nr:mechanosensitive ion channel domain-containing protein [Glaciecola sp. 33A]PKI02473.1 mechanosensitive ion channel protein MscS [Glaciecola sp. 33A]
MNYVMTVLSLIFTSTASVTEGVTEPMRSQVVADFVELLIEAGKYLGMKLELGSISYQLFALSSIFAVAIIAFLIVKFVLHFKVLRFVAKSSNTWDDCLLEAGVFRRLARIVPGIIVYSTYSLFFGPEEKIYSLLANLSAIYLLFTVWRTLSASLTAIESIYSKSQLAKKAPITGFIQVAKLLFTLILIFLILSLLLGKSPVFLLSGLTAIAAVLVLIFRDTILGFVAGIQIAANRMFNTGDWIAMPKYEVDGEILEIGLNVVKVQNWDKTISTLPTYALTTDAVKNWRGMMESGGRRIKRSVYIDIHSVRFADAGLLDEWESMKLLNGYLKGKKQELLDDRKLKDIAETDILNCRRLTNLGTFRAYLAAYLKSHEFVNQDLICMVRQLPPTEIGIPLEIYCFSKEKDWVIYERIQSDIFDHLLAIMPVFKLRAYQRISSNNEQPQKNAS